MDAKSKKLTRDDFEALTSFQVAKMRGIEFAGFLVRKDADAIFVADPQGTWVIPQESIMKMDAWGGGMCVPEDMRAVGDPVRVTLKENATFFEIRPWRVSPDPIPNTAPPMTTGDLRDIFSVGAGDVPVSNRGSLGEMQLRGLERQLTRRLGFNPDICSDPRAFSDGGLVAQAGSSATGDQDSNGGSTGHDTDSDF